MGCYQIYNQILFLKIITCIYCSKTVQLIVYVTYDAASCKGDTSATCYE